MPETNLYKSLYTKYAPHIVGEELNEKLAYAQTADPDAWVNAFYKKYTGKGPTDEQMQYINTFIGDESLKVKPVGLNAVYDREDYRVDQKF